MNVTIDDAMTLFELLKDHIDGNDYLWECYNLGISALKTIKDGDYQLKPMNVSRETLEKMAAYDCKGMSCSECKYDVRDKNYYHVCMTLRAKDILCTEQYIKEVAEWVKQNEKNL